jgi:hypothetical protein
MPNGELFFARTAEIGHFPPATKISVVRGYFQLQSVPTLIPILREMGSVIKAGFKLEHAPGMFSAILVAKILPDECRPGGGPRWELCIDSYAIFSGKQYSRQVFNIYGGLKIIKVIVIESGLWESMQNRTKLIVELVDNGAPPSAWSLPSSPPANTT